jgi:hypothetical protein
VLAEHIIWGDLYESLHILLTNTGLRRGDPIPHVNSIVVNSTTIAGGAYGSFVADGSQGMNMPY